MRILTKVGSKFALVLALMTFVRFNVTANDYTLIQTPTSLADWKSGTFYAENQAPSGIASDRIVSSDAVTEIEVNGADDELMAFLSGIQAIVISNATFSVDVPSGKTATLGCAVRDGSTVSGRFVKTGDGELNLTAVARDGQSGSTMTDYESAVVVEGGTLRFPQEGLPTSGTSYYRINSLDVGAGAKVVTIPRQTFQMRGLTGAGCFTNEASTTVRIYARGGRKTVYSFSGEIGGPMSFVIIGTIEDLSGCSNSAPVFGVMNRDGNTGEMWVRRFGMTTDDVSSIGPGSSDVILYADAPVVYTGLGETTDRSWKVDESGVILSGGTNGNLRLTGEMVTSSSTKQDLSVVLAGDGAAPNSFACAVNEWTVGDTLYTYSFVKRGLGEWQFPFTGRFNNSGLFAVENGTLSFEGIDRMGEKTSVGTALHASNDGYAFLLGSENSNETGLLSCATNLAQSCTDRPFGLKGRGGFRADCGLVKFANVFGVGSGNKTLVLSGTNSYENEIHDVRDGEGVVSVEKTGSGTWVLGGDQTFSGSLTVNGGTLVVRRAAPVYQRYRLMIMETVGRNAELSEQIGRSPGSFAGLTYNEVGLWAADDSRQNMNLTAVRNSAGLQPGQCAWGWNRELFVNGDTLDPLLRLELLFSGCRYTGESSKYGKQWHALNQATHTVCGEAQLAPSITDPHSWIPIDMYLQDGALPIDHYDVQTSVASSPYIPSAFQLFASVDGIHWDAVSETNRVTTVPSEAYCWLSDNVGGHLVNGGVPPLDPTLPTLNKSSGWKTTKTVPTKDYSLLEQVGAVSVANGAVLKYEGEASNAPVLNHVKLTSGATGSIDGFAFDSNGVFEVEELPSGCGDIAVTLPNSAGLDNVANWQVKVGGQVKPNYRVTASPSGFTVTKPGLILIFR